MARGLLQLAMYGLPDERLTTFVPLVNAVVTADVSALARRHFASRAFAIVIVGDPDIVAADLDGTPVRVLTDEASA